MHNANEASSANSLDQVLREPVAFIGALIGLALAYYLAARLGLMLAVPPGFSSAVWPASGIALGALIVGGRKLWPGVLVGSFCVNAWMSFDSSGNAAMLSSTLICMSIGIGASVQALAGEWLIRRFVGLPAALDDGRAIVRFLMLGGPVACLLNATIGIGTLFVVGAIPESNITFNWWTWWVGDVIGVLIVTPLVLVSMGKPRPVWQARLATVGVPLAAVFAMVTVFFVLARDAESRHVRQQFRDEASAMADAITREATENLEVLRSVERFFAGSRSVDRESFRVFVTRALDRHRSFPAIGWLPIVKEQERADFVAKVRQEGFSEFEITDRDELGNRLAAPSRPEHVVVLFAEPLIDNEKSLGFDVASESSRRETLAQARDTGEPATTKPTRLMDTDNHAAAAIMYMPVYRNGAPHGTVKERRENIIGYVTGSIRYNRLVAGALDSVDRTGIELRIHDLAEPEAPIYAEHSGVTLSGQEALAATTPVDGTIFTLERDIAGRRWSIAFAPTQAFLASNRPWHVWLVMAGGLTMTSMLGVFLLVLTGRTMRISAMVEGRTAELSKSNIALLESEQRLRTIIEAEPECVKVLNADEVVQEMNSAGLEMLEAESVEQVRTLGLNHFILPQYHQGIKAMNKGVLRGKSGTHTFEVQGLKGTRRWLETHAVPLRGDAGSVTAILSVTRDITDRRRAEEQVQFANAELVSARLAAETANRAKSEFLANMSHEIRTPLTAILGFAEILKEDGNISLAPRQRIQTIDTITNAGSHLLSVINDILDLSKIEADKMTIERIDTPLVSVLGEVESLIRPRASDKGVKLSVVLATPVPERIVGDPTRLRQILMNLAGNAVKFTESGSVTLIAQVQNLDGQSQITIDVEDTGPGMTPQQAERLFAAFGQADSTTTRKHGGTGLGLAISRRLANMMGGDVRLIRTEPGRGSSFRFVLPLEPIAGTAMISRLDGVADPRSTNVPGIVAVTLRGRILLAEDGLDNQRLIAFHLKKAGAIVEIAENGAVALEMLDKAATAGSPFNLLLTDMQMPEMDGYTLTRLLRKRGNTMSIVALTAHAMAEDRARCMDAGCDDYATKPIEKARLLETCAAWLDIEIAAQRRAA